MGSMLSRPIIILGAARSGTTLLAQTLLSSHPEIVYWNEPAYIWKGGFSWRADDLLGPDEISETYCNFVYESFLRRIENVVPGARFMEKTPANCLRVPAVLKVFPDAQFIHVIRDGRAVALSAAQEWTGRKSDALDSRDLRQQSFFRRLTTMFQREADFGERLMHWRTVTGLPSYSIRFLQALVRQAFHTSTIPWGPRVPGMAAFRRSYSLIETCAYQWEQCTRSACNAGRRLPSTQYMEVRFEELLKDPEAHLGLITAFLDLKPFPAEQMKILVGQVGDRSDKWRDRYSSQDLRRVEEQIGIYLGELGYLRQGSASYPNV